MLAARSGGCDVAWGGATVLSTGWEVDVQLYLLAGKLEDTSQGGWDKSRVEGLVRSGRRRVHRAQRGSDGVSDGGQEGCEGQERELGQGTGDGRAHLLDEVLRSA